jgi:hypothetical protein
VPEVVRRPIKGRRPLRRRRPNPSQQIPPSIFSEPAVQIGLFRIGATVLDRFVPGVLKLANDAIDQAMRNRVVEAVAKQDLTELKPGPDGVYRADPA